MSAAQPLHDNTKPDRCIKGWIPLAALVVGLAIVGAWIAACSGRLIVIGSELQLLLTAAAEFPPQFGLW